MSPEPRPQTTWTDPLDASNAVRGPEESHKDRSEVRRGCVVGCSSAGAAGLAAPLMSSRGWFLTLFHPRASSIFRTQRRSVPLPSPAFP